MLALPFVDSFKIVTLKDFAPLYSLSVQFFNLLSLFHLLSSYTWFTLLFLEVYVACITVELSKLLLKLPL